MNRDQKAAVIAEVATQIQESEAVFAVDYRGISVVQVAALRARLEEAGARFRVVKNTLTDIAADQAGADSLKEILEGPTAFTFVSEDGDVALAAKALAQFRRETDLLEFKGGVLGGEALSADQIAQLSRLPAKEVLHGQLVAMIASPITGLVRTLNALIAGLAIQLQKIADEGLLPAGEPAAPEQEPQVPEETASAETASDGTASEETASADADPAGSGAAEQVEGAADEQAEAPADEQVEAPADETAEAAAPEPSQAVDEPPADTTDAPSGANDTNGEPPAEPGPAAEEEQQDG